MDTRNGRAPETRRLLVRRNAAYLLILDSEGREYYRFIEPGKLTAGLSPRRPIQWEPVIARMAAALDSPATGKKKGALLLEMLECEDPYLRREAAFHFVDWGEKTAPYVPALIRAIDDPAAGPVAILALTRVGTKAKAALPYLERIAGLKGAPGRYAALVALGKIDPTGEVALPALMKVIESEESTAAAGAAVGLGYLGPRAEPAVDALIRRLDSKNTTLRHHAIEALGRIGAAAAPAIPRLEAIAGSKTCANQPRSYVAAARTALELIRKSAAKSAAPE